MPKFIFKPAQITVVALLTFFAVLCMSRTGSSLNNSQISVWTASSMEKIEYDQAAPSPSNSSADQIKNIQLVAAKGEYEAFQVVVSATSENPLENVNVLVSDLKNADGAVIKSKNISLYREHYIYLDRPSTPVSLANPTKGKGFYPDALIPFVDPDNGADIQGAKIDAVPFNLEPGKNQPIWVDISVPRFASPGEYQGTYTVESDAGSSTGNISLKVWNFELPVKPSINSAFDIWEYRGIQAQNLLLEHKLMPSQRIKYKNQEEVFNKLGVTSVRLPFWSGANYQTCTMSAAPSVEKIKHSASQYPPDILTYIYSADEIDECAGLVESVQQWGHNIHQTGAKHLVVMKPIPELYDAVDIWGVDPKLYAESRPQIAEVMEQGDEVWFYPGYHKKYSPQWNIDSPPINHRVPQGWIAQSLGFKGFFLSRTDTWTENPWQKVPVYTQGENDEMQFPGAEMLIYPGDQVGVPGVVPSMRLKWIREGVEDYEYIEILKRMGQEDWALEVGRSVGADWQNWTKDPQQLANARIKLGEKIEQMSN